MTTEDQLHSQIDALVAEEHTLRALGQSLDDSKRARLALLEVQLDRTWDLLRRRAAARDVGQNPDAVDEASERQVEGYLQ